MDTTQEQPKRRENEPFWKIGSSPPVTVLIGPDEEPFYVHRSLLVRTEFFRAALEYKGFQEAQEGIVRLPEDDPLTFACYFEWLYCGRCGNTGFIPVESSGNNERKSDTTIYPTARGTSGAEPGHNYSLQFGCYVLGDKLQCLEFQDHIMDEITRCSWLADESGQSLTVSLIRYAYANTCSDVEEYEGTIDEGENQPHHSSDPLRQFCISTLFRGKNLLSLMNDERAMEVIGSSAGEEDEDMRRDFKVALRILTMAQSARAETLEREARETWTDLAKHVVEHLRWNGCFNCAGRCECANPFQGSER